MQNIEKSEAASTTYSEVLFRSLIEHMSSCVAVYAVENDGEDFVFLEYNRAAELADRLKRENVIGKRLTEVFPSVREFGLFAVLQRVWKTGQSERFPAAYYQDSHISGWRDNYVYRLPSGEVVAIYEDITERKRAETALRELNEKLSSLLNSMAEGAYGVDTNGNCAFVNQSFLRILGYDNADEIIGQHIHELIHHSHPDGSHYPAQECRMYAAYQHFKAIHVDDEVFWHKDGSAVPVEYWSQPIVREGVVIGAIATFLDITERKKNEAMIYDLAFYDTLTHLPNRRLLNERLCQLLAATRRNGHYGAAMFMDLDNFKSLNDTYGHAAGDLLLIEAARRITECVREVDTVARLGGDEFVVLVRDLNEDETESTRQAGIVAEKIRNALARPYLVKLRSGEGVDSVVEHHCTASIGVVLFKQKATQDDVLKWADSAMYQAKDDGRNLVRFYETKI
ncbi:MAG: sensor domain-containing diguanylate cyclase [Sulfuriferula sp.]|nr:sensor domain-containing diguanylate cyclase [Sulfuriferula sp.]